MKRSSLVTIASGVLALALLIALAKIARLDVSELLHLLSGVRLFPFAALLVLTGLQVLLAAEKWRLVERRIAPGAEHPLRLCFCFTAIGTAAGQVLPMQLATALARSLGSHLVRGSGAVRGALATVFEQMFDVMVVALTGLASLACWWTGDLGRWPAGAGAAVVLGFAFTGPALGGVAAATNSLASAHTIFGDGLGRFGRMLLDARLFEAGLARRLFALSVLRFVVLWLIAIATTQAVGLNISVVQLAAALPLVVLATALAVTPGGIGVNEWTFAAALTAFGVDFETATQCALINRALAALAAGLVGVAGMLGAQIACRAAAASPASRAPADERSAAT